MKDVQLLRRNSLNRLFLFEKYILVFVNKYLSDLKSMSTYARHKSVDIGREKTVCHSNTI